MSSLVQNAKDHLIFMVWPHTNPVKFGIPFSWVHFFGFPPSVGLAKKLELKLLLTFVVDFIKILIGGSFFVEEFPILFYISGITYNCLLSHRFRRILHPRQPHHRFLLHHRTSNSTLLHPILPNHQSHRSIPHETPFSSFSFSFIFYPFCVFSLAFSLL